jgi:hypothetical protein
LQTTPTTTTITYHHHPPPPPPPCASSLQNLLGVMEAVPVSSGFALGSANWILRTDNEKVYRRNPFHPLVQGPSTHCSRPVAAPLNQVIYVADSSLSPGRHPQPLDNTLFRYAPGRGTPSRLASRWSLTRRLFFLQQLRHDDHDEPLARAAVPARGHGPGALQSRRYIPTSSPPPNTTS